MQALLDAVTDTAASERAQVRILEVASLAEITAALRADQYHVLHLFAQYHSANAITLVSQIGAPGDSSGPASSPLAPATSPATSSAADQPLAMVSSAVRRLVASPPGRIPPPS